jgi:glutamate decarboxylase
MTKPRSGDEAAMLYGNRFLTEDAPAGDFPASGMSSLDAMRLVDEELALEGDPQRNLATFVTTWMEPEAQRIIGENLYRNFIDHAEYPISAEVEQRCIRMLADLYHAPGETTGARTQGSSEAIMLGALSLKWKWKQRREAESKPTEKPNLIFGGDVHVVWEKFCRYFDVEPRIVPLQENKYVIGPEDVEPHIDENTIGVAAVLGTTFTGHADDIVGIDKLLVDLKGDRGLDAPSPSGTSGSSRCARSTSPGTSSASSIPASAGWSFARNRTWRRISSSTRTTWEKPTPLSRSTSRPAPPWSWPSTTTSSATGVRATPTS